MAKGLVFFVSLLLIVSAVVCFFTYKNLGVIEFVDGSSTYKSYYFIVYDEYGAFVDTSLPLLTSNPVNYRGQFYKLRNYFLYSEDGSPYEFRVMFIPCGFDGTYLSDSPHFVAYTRDFDYTVTDMENYKIYDVDARNLFVDYDLVFVFDRIRTAINSYNYNKISFEDVLDGNNNIFEYSVDRVISTFQLFRSLLDIIGNGGTLEF